MRELNQHLKEGKFARAYLLYGDEVFLLSHFRKRLEDAVMQDNDPTFNLDILPSRTSAADIISSCETLPFMGEHRLVILKNSGLFETGRKDDSEALAKYIEDIPDTAVLVFVESSIDKRGKLFKRVKDMGMIFEAQRPKEGELVEWAMKMAAHNKKAFPRAVAFHLVRNVGEDMQLLHVEISKLLTYVGDALEITTQHVDAICTKSLNVKIFDLMRAITKKDKKTAVKLYGDLMTLKESPFMVLSMVARQFRFYIQCGHLAKAGVSQQNIAKQLAQNPFAVKEFIEGSRNFSLEAMKQALMECLEADYAIKTGEIGDELAVEMLLVKLCSY